MTELDDILRKNRESRAKVKVPVNPGGLGNQSGMPLWWPPAYLFYGLAAGVILFVAHFAVVIGLGHLTFDPQRVNFTYFAVVFLSTFMWLKWLFLPMWMSVFLALGGRGHIFVDRDLDPDYRLKADGSGYERTNPRKLRPCDYVLTKDVPAPDYFVEHQSSIQNDPKINKIKLYSAILLFCIILISTNIVNISVYLNVFGGFEYDSSSGNQRSINDLYRVLSLGYMIFYLAIFVYNFKLVCVIIYRILGGRGDYRYIVIYDSAWARYQFNRGTQYPWHYMPPAKPVDKDAAADSE